MRISKRENEGMYYEHRQRGGIGEQETNRNIGGSNDNMESGDIGKAERINELRDEEAMSTKKREYGGIVVE